MLYGYGAEVWDLSRDNKRKLISIEMNCLRRSSRKSKLERVRNEQIREYKSVEKI